MHFARRIYRRFLDSIWVSERDKANILVSQCCCVDPLRVKSVSGHDVLTGKVTMHSYSKCTTGAPDLLLVRTVAVVYCSWFCAYDCHRSNRASSVCAPWLPHQVAIAQLFCNVANAMCSATWKHWSSQGYARQWYWFLVATLRRRELLQCGFMKKIHQAHLI